MKAMRKTLCAVLALMMLLSICAVPAFAKGSKNTCKTLTVIGDSVATGFCIFEPDGTQVGHATHGRRIVGAYPDLLCKELGLKDYNNYTREGMSSIEFRRLFDRTTSRAKKTRPSPTPSSRNTAKAGTGGPVPRTRSAKT